MALTTGAHDWEKGLDVIVEGEAVRVTDQDTLQRLAQAWAAKWDGRWPYTARDGAFYNEGFECHAFSVRPAQIFAYAKGETFGQTRHRFIE